MKIISTKINKLDLQEALKIYNHFILNSFSNFEEKKISINKFELLYKKIKINKLPFIIAKIENQVIGVAFVNRFREKSGYRFTFEHSIYINPDYINQGYGSRILNGLIKECKKNKKIKNLIAVIGDSNNSASIKIHNKNGFKYIGTLKKVGYKKKDGLILFICKEKYEKNKY